MADLRMVSYLWSFGLWKGLSLCLLLHLVLQEIVYRYPDGNNHFKKGVSVLSLYLYRVIHIELVRNNYLCEFY
jgi:hypothetical protein